MSPLPPIRLPALVRMLRPAQWTKNLVVLAAYFFAAWDSSQAAAAAGIRPALLALAAAAVFCLLSSGVYVLNDLVDRHADRLHPLKRLRPIAAGEVSVQTARAAAAVLLTAGLAAAWLLRSDFGVVATAYVALQMAYTFGLKAVALLDIFMIAAGFVLRAAGGAEVLGARISPWLLLCTFLLALFLALCKRRHEKLLLTEVPGQHRPALEGYDQRLLDQLIAVVSGATIVTYAMYTLSEETAARFGTHRIGLTIPFVIFGIFRYLDLVYRHDGGGRPEKTLLTDRVLLATIVLYGLAALSIFLTAT